MDSQLNELFRQERIDNKPQCGNNSCYAYEQVDSIVPTGKPPPIALSKTPMEPSTVSLESPKALSEISSAMSLETPLTEPLKSPKAPHAQHLELTSVKN